MADQPKRAWWKLHWLAWMWASLVAIAFVVIQRFDAPSEWSEIWSGVDSGWPFSNTLTMYAGGGPPVNIREREAIIANSILGLILITSSTVALQRLIISWLTPHH